MIKLSLTIDALGTSNLVTFAVDGKQTQETFPSISGLCDQEYSASISDLLTNFLGLRAISKEEAEELDLDIDVQDEFGIVGTNYADFVDDENEHVFICFEEMEDPVEMDYTYLDTVSVAQFTEDLKRRILFIAYELGVDCTFE
jgi:hypothetical protein